MKSAIVTGGVGGIGAAICQALSRSGFSLGIFDLNGEAAATFARTLPTAVGIEVDISEEGSVQTALQRFGRAPDVLVNNAAIAAPGGLTQDAATFFRVIRVNVAGSYIMTRAVVPEMMVRGFGAIVNITSIAATSHNPGNGAYGPSKAALSNLTKAMALSYAPYGIRVNAVAPGMVSAGMGAAAASSADVQAKRIGKIPARRIGTAQDIAGVVAFLASDGARYVTGQEIIVDGALTLGALAAE